jgi:arylsulfatase
VGEGVVTAAPQDVLVVVLDSVRARNTSVHGYDRATTPSLESFAERATVYDQARAPGAWTLASHASMFSGYHVDEHRLTHNDHAIEPGQTVWEGLSARGYRTGVFSHNPFLTGGSGLEAGFDTVVTTNQDVPYPDAVDPYDYVDDVVGFARAAVADRSPVRSMLNGVIATYEPRVLDGVGEWSADRSPARRCVDTFLEWQRSDDDRPWAACLNVVDAHWPYQPLERTWASEETVELARELATESLWAFDGGDRPWRDWAAMEDLYDDCIRQTDAAVGHLLDRLEARGALEDTLVVVTSDHGEGFGEPSRVRGVRVREHGSGAVHEAVMHVPLVVHWPFDVDDAVVAEPVSLTWLEHAIDSATTGDAEADPLRQVDGPVLASAHGLDPNESKYDEMAAHVDDPGPFTGHARAVYEAADGGVRKYVDWQAPDGTRRAATIHVDDGDTTLAARTDHGRVAAAFDGVEDAHVRAGSVEFDHRTEARLADLGYL